MARNNLTAKQLHFPLNSINNKALRDKLTDHDQALDALLGDSGEPQLLSGAGAVNLTTNLTMVTSTGASQALTLADGTRAGQRKRIMMIVDGGSSVLTAGASLHLGNSIASITLTNAKDWIDLVWSVTAGAWLLAGFGGTATGSTVTFT